MYKNMEDSKRLSVDLCVGGGFFLLFGIALCLFAYADLWAFLILAYGAAVLFYGLFRLRFPALRAQHCGWQTTCPSLALSASVSVGFGWILSLWIDRPFDPEAKLGRLDLLFGKLGWVSWVLLAGSLALYAWQRRKRPSRKGVLLDAGLCALYLAPFFWSFCLLFLWVEYWVH